jgi:hypothetical protein
VTKQEGGRLPKSHLETHVGWKTPITLASLTHRLHQAGAGANDLKEILEDRDRELVDARCGARYHPTNERYRRAGVKERTLKTILGTIQVSVTRVRDQKRKRIFVPLWRDVRVRAKRRYQDDIVEVAISGVERMTYGNTVEELDKSTLAAMSKRSLNRYVLEHGKQLQKHLQKRTLQAEAVVPDGTKLRAQQGRHHQLKVTITENQDGTVQLRQLDVNQKWSSHSKTVHGSTLFVDSDNEPGPPRVVTDGEPGLQEAFNPQESYIQDCHIHVNRALGHALWRDGLFKNNPERRDVQNRVSGVLAHLRNSLALHLPKRRKRKIRKRIKQTRRELLDIVEELVERQRFQAAGCLRGVVDTVVVFAQLALEGYWMPWHTNRVERVMLEVAKRCKHRGMRWTEEGSSALLALLVYRFLEPAAYRDWWMEKLHGSARFKADLGIQVTVTGARGF